MLGPGQEGWLREAFWYHYQSFAVEVLGSPGHATEKKYTSRPFEGRLSLQRDSVRANTPSSAYFRVISLAA
jgi:hypothetical protein